LSLLKYLVLGIGGAIGTITRYMLSTILNPVYEMPVFPIGTMTVNLSGSFIIGLLAGFSEYGILTNPGTRLFLFVGLLGGFTTFSSFSLETLNMFRHHQWKGALVYLGISNIGGLILAFAGFQLASLLIRK